MARSSCSAASRSRPACARSARFSQPKVNGTRTGCSLDIRSPRPCVTSKKHFRTESVALSVIGDLPCLKGQVPPGRLALPEEIANVYAFLASD